MSAAPVPTLTPFAPPTPPETRGGVNTEAMRETMDNAMRIAATNQQIVNLDTEETRRAREYDAMASVHRSAAHRTLVTWATGAFSAVVFLGWIFAGKRGA